MIASVFLFSFQNATGKWLAPTGVQAAQPDLAAGRVTAQVARHL